MLMLMLKNIYVQSFGISLIFAVLTIIFGAFREVVFIPETGLSANFARAILLPVALYYIIRITYLFLKKTKASYIKSDLIKIGILWFLLSILFEFGFGSLVMGHPIEKLLADYNLLEGKTWSLFLLCVLFAPYMVNKYYLKQKHIFY